MKNVYKRRCFRDTVKAIDNAVRWRDERDRTSMSYATWPREPQNHLEDVAAFSIRGDSGWRSTYRECASAFAISRYEAFPDDQLVWSGGSHLSGAAQRCTFANEARTGGNNGTLSVRMGLYVVCGAGWFMRSRARFVAGTTGTWSTAAARP